jgi:PD-(D/E)XK nuclease superfamily protein
MSKGSSPRTDPTTRKPDMIENKKQRGEWAESVFMAKAHEHGLPVSKPWGHSWPYDFVVGTTGRFVSVQVKSTLNRPVSGYVCTVQSHHGPYAAGSFDFVAAYVIPTDTWYIIPAAVMQGMKWVTLQPDSPNSKYEPYREAWHLFREAIAAKEEMNVDASDAEKPAEPERPPRNALERMEASFRFMKGRLEV